MGLRQPRQGRRRDIENIPIPRPRGLKGRKTMNRRIILFMLVALATGVVKETITSRGV